MVDIQESKSNGIHLEKYEPTQRLGNLFLNPKDTSIAPPNVNGNLYVLEGKLHSWSGKSVPVHAPIYRNGDAEQISIGTMPMMSSDCSLQAVESSVKAYNLGVGYWPQMGVRKRVECIENFVKGLKSKRNEIANLLMWEICKNRADAEKEVDRTVDYINATIVELKRLENSFSKFVQVGGVVGHERRAPLGVTLVMGPFNYPLNETYTLLIPALIMGNTVIMKLPRTGYLCHMPTLELFASCFPPGVVNTISGAGRETMPPLMKTGKIDVFAFIGTNSAANQLIKQHPAPHRLRICLGLDAKNPAIILPSADIKATVSEVVLGALSYNGQRCTAIKIVFVHESIVDLFLPELIKQVDALKIGLPWESGVKITPLPEPDKPEYIRTVIEDATNKGARIVNANGGQYDRSMVSPSVLYPVTSNMRVYAEEQFGPIIPVVTFNDISEIVKYLTECEFGQQASIFSTNASEIATLTDILVHQVCRVNVNAQCQRGPDTFPFTGRKNSAAGTLSISDALRTFSIRSMVATKDDQKNRELLTNVVQSNQSNFLRLDHIF